MHLFIDHMIFNSFMGSKDADRLFLPDTYVDGEKVNNSPHKPAIKIGFVPMTGGETPGGLYLTVVRDAQEKLLAYLLTGGSLEAIDGSIMNTFTNEDFIVVLGRDLEGKLKAVFAVDIYERNADGVYIYPHHKPAWGVEDVVNHVFANAKLIDTMES
jgi:hypothetical protein